MSLSPTEIVKLRKLITLAGELLASAEPAKKRAVKDAPKQPGRRARRTGKDLVAFRQMLKAERKKGVRVEDLAQKHGISTAYIYQLGS
jgi:hypothetical protein